MTIKTRLTKPFALKHPIALALMTQVSSGRLASAVAEAGGLGVLRGGYVNRAWFEMRRPR